MAGSLVWRRAGSAAERAGGGAGRDVCRLRVDRRRRGRTGTAAIRAAREGARRRGQATHVGTGLQSVPRNGRARGRRARGRRRAAREAAGMAAGAAEPSRLKPCLSSIARRRRGTRAARSSARATNASGTARRGVNPRSSRIDVRRACSACHNGTAALPAGGAGGGRLPGMHALGSARWNAQAEAKEATRRASGRRDRRALPAPPALAADCSAHGDAARAAAAPTAPATPPRPRSRRAAARAGATAGGWARGAVRGGGRRRVHLRRRLLAPRHCSTSPPAGAVRAAVSTRRAARTSQWRCSSRRAVRAAGDRYGNATCTGGACSRRRLLGSRCNHSEAALRAAMRPSRRAPTALRLAVGDVSGTPLVFAPQGEAEHQQWTTAAAEGGGGGVRTRWRRRPTCVRRRRSTWASNFSF